MRNARRAGFVVFAAMVVLLGLMLGAQAKRARKGAKATPAASAECKTDADCLLVPEDCCPCDQGGKQRAVFKKEKDAYEKARHKRCGDTQCIEMMSQDPSCTQHAICGAGICELGG